MTHEVRASEAKAQLLDEVERGETIIITRHGRPIARLVPEADRRQHEIDRAIDEMKQLARDRKLFEQMRAMVAQHWP